MKVSFPPKPWTPPEPHVVAEIEGVTGLKAIRRKVGKKALGLQVHGRAAVAVGPEVYDSFRFGWAFTTGGGCDTA